MKKWIKKNAYIIIITSAWVLGFVIFLIAFSMDMYNRNHGIGVAP
jgi:hypothetical protein